MKKYVKFALIKQELECDFCCGDDPIYHSYQAEDFIINKEADWVSESKGAWAACKACYDFIEADNWKGLLNRSVASFKKQYGVEPPDLRYSLSVIHNLFRQHMRRSA